MPKPDLTPPWYKTAVIYQVHVRSFFDSDGDGIGDFRGLTEKLDHIADLGADTIWLLPFFPSPLRDDGYDVSDYCGVNPDYGTLDDFREFLGAAHRRGMRVLVELVVNHTSDAHPWFQRARRAPEGSPERNYYVWSDTGHEYGEARVIFLDSEVSNWAWDPVARAYYWHRFYAHQPDLNFDSPDVVREVKAILKFWIDLGVDGFRLDAVPYLVERENTTGENLEETHGVLKMIRAEVERLDPECVLLAEANQWPGEAMHYFGRGDECHMAFHFPLMPRMFMALAEADATPIRHIVETTMRVPECCQWAIFLRNHDELTLEMVTDEERDRMWRFYAAHRRLRINLGIRRRLASLVDGDRKRMELLNALLLSLPGTPVIYYGDEIGMGDNPFLGDRDGVRTPMHWSDDRNAGFSRAPGVSLFLPPVTDPVFGYHAVNVAQQRQVRSSLLNWMRRMLRVRTGCPAFGAGAFAFLETGNPAVLAYTRRLGDDVVLCLANLAEIPQGAELDLSAFAGRRPVCMVGGSVMPAIGSGRQPFILGGLGHLWLALAEPSRVEAFVRRAEAAVPDLPGATPTPPVPGGAAAR